MTTTERSSCSSLNTIAEVPELEAMEIEETVEVEKIESGVKKSIKKDKKLKEIKINIDEIKIEQFETDRTKKREQPEPATSEEKKQTKRTYRIGRMDDNDPKISKDSVNFMGCDFNESPLQTKEFDSGEFEIKELMEILDNEEDKTSFLSVTGRPPTPHSLKRNIIVKRTFSENLPATFGPEEPNPENIETIETIETIELAPKDEKNSAEKKRRRGFKRWFHFSCLGKKHK